MSCNNDEYKRWSHKGCGRKEMMLRLKNQIKTLPLVTHFPFKIKSGTKTYYDEKTDTYFGWHPELDELLTNWNK